MSQCRSTTARIPLFIPPVPPDVHVLAHSCFPFRSTRCDRPTIEEGCVALTIFLDVEKNGQAHTRINDHTTEHRESDSQTREYGVIFQKSWVASFRRQWTKAGSKVKSDDGRVWL